MFAHRAVQEFLAFTQPFSTRCTFHMGFSVTKLLAVIWGNSVTSDSDKPAIPWDRVADSMSQATTYTQMTQGSR